MPRPITSTPTTDLVVRVALPALHDDQRRAASAMRGAAVGVLCAGRRWGKSHLLTDIAVRAGLRGKHVGYFAPTYKLLLPVWEAVLAYIPPSLADVARAQHRLDIPATGGRIECWSLDVSAMAARGRGYDLAIIDEAGVVPGLRKVVTENVMPTLINRPGAKLLIAGTPKGRNDFWAVWQQAETQAGWARVHARTSDNPLIATSTLTTLRASMTERAARQELDAEFLTDGGAVFRNIYSCLVDEPARSDEPAVIGIDWGRTTDATVAIAVDPITHHVIDVVRLVDVPFAHQFSSITALWQRTGCGPVVAEANAIGMEPVEQLMANGLPVQPITVTHARKTQLIDQLVMAIEQTRLAIPRRHEWLISELEVYEATTSPSGLIRYGAPDGLHDDGVMALALAWAGLHDAPAVLFEV